MVSISFAIPRETFYWRSEYLEQTTICPLFLANLPLKRGNWKKIWGDGSQTHTNKIVHTSTFKMITKSLFKTVLIKNVKLGFFFYTYSTVQKEWFAYYTSSSSTSYDTRYRHPVCSFLFYCELLLLDYSNNYQVFKKCKKQNKNLTTKKSSSPTLTVCPKVPLKYSFTPCTLM